MYDSYYTSVSWSVWKRIVKYQSLLYPQFSISLSKLENRITFCQQQSDRDFQSSQITNVLLNGTDSSRFTRLAQVYEILHWLLHRYTSLRHEKQLGKSVFAQ